MECFKEGMNLDSTDESDAKASEDILEKMDDYQFVRYVENHCINLQNSLGITEDELNEQGTKNPLLWEKSFEHEILLDVDDDFNLNFNDVCDSYIICLSQSSAEDVGFNIAAGLFLKKVTIILLFYEGIPIIFSQVTKYCSTSIGIP